MTALDELAAYRYRGAETAELRAVSIDVRETSKARCCVSLSVHREVEGELIYRAWEIEFRGVRDSSKAQSAAARPGSS